MKPNQYFRAFIYRINCKQVAMVMIALTAIIVLYSMIENSQEINRLRKRLKTLHKIISNSYMKSKSYHKETNIGHDLEEKEIQHGTSGVFSTLFDYYFSNKGMMVIYLFSLKGSNKLLA